MIQLPEFLFFFSQCFTGGNHIGACTHSKLISIFRKTQAELEKKEKSIKKERKRLFEDNEEKKRGQLIEN